MKDKYIYVVFGSTGEYDDYRQWSVKAFSKEENANKFADQCQKLITIDRREYSHMGWKHPLDPNFQIDYNGTSYEVEKILFDS